MDYMRHTLLIYDSSGSFLNEFGGAGWGPGWFSYPKDICIDNLGRLFVADTFNQRVQVFQTRF
jgi:tripartite motif-containing protein 2/3/tripartite motif-containing protein 71